MTFMTKLLRLQLELTKPFVAGCSIETTRKGQERLGELMAIAHRQDVYYVSREFDLFVGEWVLPKEQKRQGVILYLHGGGYIGGDLEYAKGYATILAAEHHIKTFCIAYRLAPECPFPAALEDALSAYQYLLKAGYPAQEIVLAGESAGGGLIFCLCLKLKELGLPLPAGLIAISPWSDLTQSGRSYESNAEVDPTMTKERLDYYSECYTSDPANPLASPVFADLTGLPPSIVFVGGDEVMLDDAAALHRRLLEAGCESELTVTPEMWHAYILYGVKEAEQDTKKIGQFLTEVLS